MQQALVFRDTWHYPKPLADEAAGCFWSMPATVVTTSVVEAYLLISFVKFQMEHFSEHSLASWHLYCDPTASHTTNEWLRQRWWSCAVRSGVRSWSCLTVWQRSHSDHPTKKCVIAVAETSQENKPKRDKLKKLRRRITNMIVMFFFSTKNT